MCGKLDTVAMVFIHGVHYFNVFRRYNDPAEIIVEDYCGDFYFQQDGTVSDSLKNVLCLCDSQMESFRTIGLTTMKSANGINCEIKNMKWSDVHTEFVTVSVNFGGILEDFHHAQVTAQAPSKKRKGENLLDRFDEAFDLDEDEENYMVLRSGLRFLRKSAQKYEMS